MGADGPGEASLPQGEGQQEQGAEGAAGEDDPEGTPPPPPP
ncbi:hypothetical protein ACR6C2_14190 [Streptomyces sp. INA 01156]